MSVISLFLTFTVNSNPARTLCQLTEGGRGISVSLLPQPFFPTQPPFCDAGITCIFGAAMPLLTHWSHSCCQLYRTELEPSWLSLPSASGQRLCDALILKLLLVVQTLWIVYFQEKKSLYLRLALLILILDATLKAVGNNSLILCEDRKKYSEFVSLHAFWNEVLGNITTAVQVFDRRRGGDV